MNRRDLLKKASALAASAIAFNVNAEDNSLPVIKFDSMTGISNLEELFANATWEIDHDRVILYNNYRKEEYCERQEVFAFLPEERALRQIVKDETITLFYGKVKIVRFRYLEEIYPLKAREPGSPLIKDTEESIVKCMPYSRQFAL